MKAPLDGALITDQTKNICLHFNGYPILYEVPKCFFASKFKSLSISSELCLKINGIFRFVGLPAIPLEHIKNYSKD